MKCAPVKHGVRSAGAPLAACALLVVLSSAALADGGAGGFGAGGGPGGAGGTGFTGNPGQAGTAGSNGGGGGGGGAGGGLGGAGGANTSVGGSAAGGNGGNGGVNGNGAGAATITNTSPLAGAAGGGGGGGNGGGGGGGGAGGYGAIVTSGGASSNNSSITAGKGGNGGNGDLINDGGSGGDGGVGVQFTVTGASFTNSGSVIGGRGGNAGSGGGLGGTNGNPGAGGVGVVGAGITIVNSGSIAGGLSGDGVTQANAITFSSGANTLTLQIGSSLTGNIEIDGGGSVTFNQSTAQALSNVIAGSGSIIQAGPGTLTLTGTNTYSGATTVSGGTLEIDGSIANSVSVTVNSGGVLSGTGTVGPATTTMMSGGTLAPGSGAPGSTMSIAGNLAFQSGALYLVALNPSAASRANVTGSASLAGTAEAAFAPGSYLVHVYDILHAAGGLNGTTFNTLTTANLPSGFMASLSYTPTDVMLNLTAQVGISGQPGGNQQTIATTINNFFNSGGALPPGFAALFTLTGAAQTSALTQLDGEDATGAERGAFDLMNEFLDLMLDPYVDGRGGFGSGGQPLDFAPDQVNGLPPEIALAYAGLLKAPPASRGGFAQRWTAWGAGFGGSAMAKGDPAVGSSNVTTGSFGYATGLDYHYSPDTVAGFSLAGGGTNWNLAQGLGGGRSNAFLAGIYGVTRQGPAYLAAALAFANDWFTTNRTAFAGDQLTARFQGQSYSARLEGGYRFAVPAPSLPSPASGAGLGWGWGNIGLTPYVAIQTQEFRTPAYSEDDLTGGSFALSYGAMNGTDTRSELGTRFDDLTALGDMPLVLRAKLAWAHDWVGNAALNASFVSLPGTGFKVVGAPLPHDSALTSLGAQLFVTPHWSLLAKFDGEFASTSQIYAGSGTLRYTW